MGLDKDKDGEEEVHKTEEEEELNRQTSQASLDVTTDQEDDEEDDEERTIELGPQRTLKEQLEKDKEDESLRRWKEQLLGSVDLNSVGETLDPDVKILSLSINSPGRDAIVLPIPEEGNPKGLWFTLKENSRYSLEFSFKVSNNIVSGLKYTNTVWKTAVKGKLCHFSNCLPIIR
ncbi:hypothetical protein C5167_009494 [Papaver somniferum]|uniref:Rho GDP-dissociation inhibitor 1 n=1 Tax=Papaver somniferum TaxID=3469 RepID=A0A4Y7K0F4_PAPSO|nr:hypothetical protein C5167_009494 [Papaver somniferum]